MGDWYTVFSNDHERATEYYREAWSVLREVEGEEPAAAAFAEPKRLAYQRSPLPPRGETATITLESNPEEQVGFVLVEYTVTKDGLAEDVQIVETSPPGWVRQERAVLRSMRTARFRPRLEEGEPVATPGIKIKHEFRYVE
jgi:TonB family protein